MTNPEEIHYVTEEQVEAALKIIREYDEANRDSSDRHCYLPIHLDTILDEMNDPMLERTAAVNRVTSLVYELWQDDRVHHVDEDSIEFALEQDWGQR